MSGSSPNTGVEIGQAVAWMKQGKRIERPGWNGKGMYLYLVPAAVLKSADLPMFREGEELPMQPHVVMRTAVGTHVPWLCSQTDLLAVDWICLDCDDDS